MRGGAVLKSVIWRLALRTWLLLPGFRSRQLGSLSQQPEQRHPVLWFRSTEETQVQTEGLPAPRDPAPCLTPAPVLRLLVGMAPS